MKDIVEVWRPVVNYEDRYEVSSLGRVRSLYEHRFHQILNQRKNANGYWTVAFWRDGKKIGTKLVSRLVAMAFLGPPKEGEIVLHGPLGKENNSVSNLSWGTYRQNILDRLRDGTAHSGSRHFKTKFNDGIAREIFDMYINGYSKRFIGEKFNMTHQNVHAVLIAKTWKHIYAEKMGVSLQEVYDMWALGQSHATRMSLVHLKNLARDGSTLLAASNVQPVGQVILSKK